MSNPMPKITYRRQSEPRENAFTLLVPEGWTIEGGVVRVSPVTGSAQAGAAKFDIAFKADPAGGQAAQFVFRAACLAISVLRPPALYCSPTSAAP